jgi:hypothetical protein
MENDPIWRRMITPMYLPDYAEKAQLVNTMNTPGFQVFLKILKSEIDKFFIPFINKELDDDKGILAAHMGLKVACQVQEGIVNRLNSEREDFTNAVQDGDVEPDITAGIIDIGDNVEEIV